jgi:hypothetical protein
VIALEMTLGAVVAGPFDVAESALTSMIQSVMNEEKGKEEKWKSGKVEKWKSKSNVH